MARKNNFEKTKYNNIVSLENADGSIHYYANFMLDGVSYQKKNLTKLKNVKTAAKARDELENIKSELRQGRNPFFDTGGDKVKDIILKSISKREPTGKSSAYKKSLEDFYYKYIDPVIGHLFLGKVTDRHVEKIMKPLGGYKKEYKQNVQILMFKIFETEFRKDNIKHNPFYDIDYGTHKDKEDFDTRVKDSIEDVAKKLFKTAKEYNPKYRLFLVITIMLARRVGEIHKLKLGNIMFSEKDGWHILAKNDITKTKIVEKYPLPYEVVNMLPKDVLNEEYENEKLFNFSSAGITLHWNKLVEEAKININKGYTITSHDSRKMFLSILSFMGTDSDLADRCISHKKRGMKGVYLDVPYRIRKEIFEDWWKFLRN